MQDLKKSVVIDYTGKSDVVDTQYGYYYPNSRHDLDLYLDYTGKSGAVDTQYGYYYPNSRHDLDLYTNQLGN